MRLSFRVISSFVPLLDLVFLVLAFFGSSSLSCHFRPFTGYRTETSARLCEKCRNLKNQGLHGCHGWILACRLTETPYKLHTRFIALYESKVSTESVVCFVSVLTKADYSK